METGGEDARTQASALRVESGECCDMLAGGGDWAMAAAAGASNTKLPMYVPFAATGAARQISSTSRLAEQA